MAPASPTPPSRPTPPEHGEPNIDAVTDPIEAIDPTGAVIADGALHRVDTIIFATGSHVTDIPTFPCDRQPGVPM